MAFELSLPANIDVNPMTAVAEGASIFAESIDWSTESHNRKATNEIVSTSIDLSFKFTAKERAVCTLEQVYQQQIDSGIVQLILPISRTPKKANPPQ